MSQSISEPPEWPSTEDGVLKPDEKAKSVFMAQVEVATAGFKALQDRDTETLKDSLSRQATRLEGQAAEDEAEADGFRSEATAERAADLANLSKWFDNMSTLSMGALERGRSGAEVVQKASAAIVTLYTGILALVFAAGDNPLPARGVLAPVFLGLAVVLSTAYLGYVTRSTDITPAPAVVSGVESKTYARLNTTTAVASIIATRRSYTLRASVVALGVGLVFIVLPFVSLGATAEPAAAAPSSPAWPSPAPEASTDALAAIVYKAQVDEVAAARKAMADQAAAPPVDDTITLVLIGLLGLAVTFGVPKVWTDS